MPIVPGGQFPVEYETEGVRTVAYDPFSPGLDEARLFAYQALLIANLASLNQALGRDDLTPIGTVTEAMVCIGDPDSMWDPIVDGGAVRFRVIGGDEAGSPNADTATWTGLNKNAGFEYTFHTCVRCYLHPDALSNLDPIAQAQARQITLARIYDWFTQGVCNYWDPVAQVGSVIVDLGTNIITPFASGKTDHLLDAWVRESRKPWVLKQYGQGVWFPCLEFLLEGTVG